ncbi:DUF1206 domain-containing protein [Pleurocapsales cyanobacterium LEGE 06147]|nr:DUF1206 domain-containing protein [Pleurocapsales cyanobacterium LEGE 06147]
MWLEKIARFGYLTKGFVYFLLSLLVVDIVVDNNSKTAKVSTTGALEALSIQPFGRLVLSVVAVGLISYALWRFLQAAIAPGHSQKKLLEKIFVRLGYTLSGLSYTGLALSAIEIILRIKNEESSSPSDWTARLLSLPFGQWLVGALGLAVIGVGISYLRHAVTPPADLHLDLPEIKKKLGIWIIWIGRVGITARASVFGLVGVFLIEAALQFDAEQARGLDGALQTLAQQPLGKLMLVVVALGLCAYSIYMFVEARFRYMKPLEALAEDLKHI